MALPDCPYCGGPSDMVHHDQADDVDYLACLICLSEFAQLPDGEVAYVLEYVDVDPEKP